ncbi:MAG: response regulator [Candidatus Xenobia bacterium]
MIRVLLADDHTILRDGVRMLLETDPEIEVIGMASTGLEAVRMTVVLKPDVVLMDIQMPEVDGIDATERLGRQAPGTKVLILSQLDTEEHLSKVLEVGAQGYVLKQSATDELLDAVKTVMQGHVYMTPAMASRLVKRYLRREDDKAQKARMLTGREQEVLKGICEGLTNQQIAEQLGLSIKTVQSHRGNIMEKLDLHNRVDLVKYAIRMGIASADKAGEVSA